MCFKYQLISFTNQFRGGLRLGSAVAVETGLRAAKSLQLALDNHATVAEMMLAVHRITAAVCSTVPKPLREQISA